MLRDCAGGGDARFETRGASAQTAEHAFALLISRPHAPHPTAATPAQWVDGSLRDKEWYRQVFEHLKRDHPKYRIAIFHVVASDEEILSRAKRRGELTGRHVPESEIWDSIRRVPDAVEVLAPLCRFVATLDNSSDPPLLVRCRDLKRGFDISAPPGESCSWNEIQRRFVFKGFERFADAISRASRASLASQKQLLRASLRSSIAGERASKRNSNYPPATTDAGGGRFSNRHTSASDANARGAPAALPTLAEMSGESRGSASINSRKSQPTTPPAAAG